MMTATKDLIVRAGTPVLVLGNPFQVYKEIETVLLSESEIETKSYYVDSLGIDMARDEIRLELSRASNKSRRVVLVSAISYTTEAQNALLKCIEELPTATAFVLVAESESRLLATVRSRMMVVDMRALAQDSKFGKSFLFSSPGERMKMCKDLLSKSTDERKGELRGLLLELVVSVEKDISYVHGKMTAEEARISTTVYEYKKMALLRHAHVKMITEGLCLSLPVIRLGSVAK